MRDTPGASEAKHSSEWPEVQGSSCKPWWTHLRGVEARVVRTVCAPDPGGPMETVWITAMRQPRRESQKEGSISISNMINAASS
jgi:hypothetical protein